jgi:hypothetical protein
MIYVSFLIHFLRFSAPGLCLQLAALSIERGGKTTRLREEEASVT